MIERGESGTTTITGGDIGVYRVLTIRRDLILRIDTGMSLTRISGLKIAQQDGITVERTCRGALRDVNAWLVERGAEAKWSKKYPQG